MSADHKTLLNPHDLRTTLVPMLRDASAGLLLDPGQNKRAFEQAEALRQLLIGYEELVVSTSSSNSGYEFRDLPPAEKACWEQAKRSIALLHQIHNPCQEAKA